MSRPRRADRSTVADTPLTIRLTPLDRAVLSEVLRLRQEELGRDAKVSQASFLRGLLYKEATARDVDVNALAAGLGAAKRKKTSP